MIIILRQEFAINRLFPLVTPAFCLLEADSLMLYPSL